MLRELQCPLAHRSAVEVLLESVDATRLPLLLAAMLLDKSIVLWGSQTQQLFLVVRHYPVIALILSCCQAQGLLGLIWPLKWDHTYIPVLPHKLLGCLGSPAPLLVGIHSDLKSYAQPHLQDTTLQLDLDSGRLHLPHRSTLPHSPDASLFEQRVQQCMRPQNLDWCTKPTTNRYKTAVSAALEWVSTLLCGCSHDICEISVK